MKKASTIMFMKNGVSQRMFMDCTDVFNWLTINGHGTITTQLHQKMQRAESDIRRHEKAEKAKGSIWGMDYKTDPKGVELKPKKKRFFWL